MTGFTFSAEQLRAAPAEVRRWAEQEITAALGGLAGVGPAPAPPHAPGLAACRPQEAAQMVEALQGDFLLLQVFLELARETPPARAAAPLRVLDLAEMLRHTRLGDGARLAQCLGAINQVFQAVRGDPEATLFGFDTGGHVYVHETTHQSVREVWQQLLARHPAPAAEPDLQEFTPPRLGPSEDIAPHIGSG